MSTFVRNLYEDAPSALTSEVYFVGDAEEMTISFAASSAASAHIQASNDRGFREAITSWSTLTSLAIPTTGDLLNIEPGFRFIRISRNSNTLSEAQLSGRNNFGSS